MTWHDRTAQDSTGQNQKLELIPRISIPPCQAQPIDTTHSSFGPLFQVVGVRVGYGRIRRCGATGCPRKSKTARDTMLASLSECELPRTIHPINILFYLRTLPLARKADSPPSR